MDLNMVLPITLIVVAVIRVCSTLDCNEVQDCKSCVTKSSGFSTCRWCPLDRECHAFGAVRANPCNGDTNIIQDPNKCPPELEYGVFNADEAYRDTLLSAIAYSDQPEKCTEDMLISEEYEIVSVVVRTCKEGSIWAGSQCFVYIAVSKKFKDIVVAFRGSTSVLQLTEQFVSVLLESKTKSPIGGKVQEFFKKAHDSFYDCLKKSVQDILSLHPDFNVKITGHSLGAAIASITSARLVKEGIINRNKMSLYTFGMPRVGNGVYAVNHDLLVNNSWRVVHSRDIVVHLPSCKFIPCVDKPFHHKTEVFYPNSAMTVNSLFTVCEKNEDSKCSNGAIDDDWCIDINTCINFHKSYYGVNVGSHCYNLEKKRRRKRDAGEWAFSNPGVASNTECRIFKHVNRTWVPTTSNHNTSAATNVIVSFIFKVSTLLSCVYHFLFY